MDKKILTIQDISCVGQCSLTVALPIISACGIETAILPGAVLSNHTAPGFSGWSFNDLTDEMPKILARWNKENIKFDAFYTGYVTKMQIPHILDIIAQTAKTGALVIVDPAMADNGKLYAGFDSNFPKEMAKLCKGADYILPNLTEASFLLDIPYVGENYDEAYIQKISRELSAKFSVKNVIITGVSLSPKKLGASIYHSDDDSFEYYFNDWIDAMFHGTGDLFSSAFAGAIMRGKTALQAVKIAADFVVKSIELTLDDKAHWYGVKFEKALGSLIKNFD